MKRVLITGADGFLGRYIARAARNSFAPVLHVRTAESWYRWRSEGFEHVLLGDLSAGACLEEAPDVDVVLHLAGRSFGSATELYRANVLTTAAVIDWAARRQVGRLIVCSTGAVYEDRDDRPSREDDPLAPASHYAGSKVAAETVARQAAALSGDRLRATILRFPHVYGPDNQKGVVWNFLESTLARGRILLDGEGTQQRDFLYVDDAIAALLAVLACDQTDDVLTLNIGTGRKHSLRDLGNLLAQALGQNVTFESSGRPEQPPHCIWLDSRAAGNTLQWSARVDLDNGLKRTVAWRLAAVPAGPASQHSASAQASY